MWTGQYFSSLSATQFSCKGERVCFGFGICHKRYYQKLKTGDVAPCLSNLLQVWPHDVLWHFFLKCLNGGTPFAWTDTGFQSCFYLSDHFGCYEMVWKRGWNAECVPRDGLFLFLIFLLALHFSVYTFVAQSSPIKRYLRRSSPGINYSSWKQKSVS